MVVRQVEEFRVRWNGRLVVVAVAEGGEDKPAATGSWNCRESVA